MAFSWKTLGYITDDEKGEISKAPNGKSLNQFSVRGRNGRNVTVYHSHRPR